MRRDYYAVLGITSTAGPREVRQAFRRLARQYSPDVNFWDAQAQTLFEEIAEAYRVLNDPGARALYDRFGTALAEGEALGAGQRGEDVHVSIDLDFADVARGARVHVEVPRFLPCADCRATGQADGARCGACHGRGVRRVIEPVTVAVPAGVDAGVQIRVPGEGSAGPFGGPRGDLLVSTRVAEHPFFARKGDSVHCEVPITVWEALQGARIRVPTPAGEAALVVPPGTAGGRMFRLRGQGLPKLAADGTGDLYVTVRVELPAGLDARTYELVRELERLLPLEPRAALARYRGGAA
ncbi:MAG: hypothetical protein A3I14_17145 [Candidatus Rokubacteria bacterium RIFCSPLOWO2_02_FULL_73_56]|nr:MAG: hypothetical protein A3D33_05210 [Candidatus Rokubacteria bacterium RIFCSPHIGHO2_02_FULL_73_26]OGL09999.1 MAG: hypothetical protein A3I14_17145 [Candidatus Rokubacteria bacterium RIFCSPLOWO2_02_FULL_73_56]OGL20892.1 MAG: hypothetical protein A3G44_16660 [Candidatus Rokubacteria bacterium RIFCSPLOWO2_12_FULL_73_47]